MGAALDLLDRAGVALLESGRATTTTDRYTHAQLGALRAGAALLAARGRVPSAARGGDVWSTLAVAHPELAEWAGHFAVCTRRRREIEAGADRPAAREADDALRAADTFVGLVQAALGLPITRIDPLLAPALVAGAPRAQPGAARPVPAPEAPPAPGATGASDPRDATGATGATDVAGVTDALGVTEATGAIHAREPARVGAS
ncbi:SAV_6107 family HEPN domain-containing protein [Agilicoccus flavus]|uniref:SAV_6107 family HEPN domain-containing protein n=1 Tax=Agilicoccus flavus TaxID=2775968 RepID=UPI001CF69190|nr:SAV_6107 family HEPN domain-containing protein [Agilicoccus flavus]